MAAANRNVSRLNIAISPTMTTFGSVADVAQPLARSDRSQVSHQSAKPPANDTTGSSMVIMRRCTELMLERKQ